ncbi:MAG: trigger factor [Candidatus Saganbacteria bacterium]|nr:trigger factor [Candidatus Saganbacteria bacterium]
MKILKQDKTGSNVKLEVEADYDEFKKAYEKLFGEAGREIKIPGFRPGKAPRNILEQNINAEYVKDRALEHVIKTNLSDIIKESGLEVIEIQNWLPVSLDGKCVFSLDVVVQPDVELGKYKGVQTERTSVKVEEKDIEAHINSIIEEGAQVKEVTDRPVKHGDIAELDIEGSTDGSVRDALSQKALPILTGDDRIAPGFDINIEGMSVGDEKEFSIPLPQDYYIKEFAGEKASFKVSLKKIAGRDLPEFNDEYVKKISSFNTADEYRSDVRKRMEEAVKKDSEDKAKDDLLKKVLEDSKVDVPDAAVRRETDTMIEEMNSNLQSKGLTLDYYLNARKLTKEGFTEELKPKATERAKAKLVLRAIAKNEGISVTEEECENEIKEISKQMGRPEEDNRNEMMKEYIRDYLLRTKALDFIFENAKIKG